MNGTSPRGWGKPPSRIPGHLISRNIPTRVGKTSTDKARRGAKPEHPHAGGENFALPRGSAPPSGTSPRGWGKHEARCPRLADKRNIPTRVGKTLNTEFEPLVSTEHPHAGGENNLPLSMSSRRGGTSPRGWGKQPNLKKAATTVRNIPTRVGKTRNSPSIAALASEHPHAGGENDRNMDCWIWSSGTSPRGWGKHTLFGSRNACHRNIPTRVGKTRLVCRCMSGRAEHPHAGGENVNV